MGTAGYLEALGGEDRHHLGEVRRLRRTVCVDKTLDPLDRAVLGLTGSAEQLERYRKLAAKIGAAAGQPVTKVDRNMRRGDRVWAKGGIIAGELKIDSSSFDVNKEVGTASGHAIFTVAVERMVNYYGEGQPTIGDPGRITVAHLINHEWENHTVDPDKDFYDAVPLDSSLIGRKAIYESEHFRQGVSTLLLAIEDTARVAALS